MANLVKLVSFFILVLLWPKALANIIVEVKEMMDEFTSLTAPTHDIISGLRTLSEDAGNFLRVAGPVGALIAAATKTAFKPKPDELEASKKLHNYLKTAFEKLELERGELTRKFTQPLGENQYREVVTLPLNRIEHFYKDITDPNKKRSLYKQEFIRECNKIGSSPLIVLVDMKRSLKTDCRLPSQEQMEGYAEVLELFQKIEKRHFLYDNNFIQTEEYQYLKHSLLAKRTGSYLQSELNKILHTANSKDAGQALIKLYTDSLFVQRACWLETIAVANEWEREPLFNFARMVRLDLVKAFLISSHCAEVYDGGIIKDELEEIKLLFEEIATHMANWIEKLLEITWPTISRAYAKNKIGTTAIVESEAEYKIVAQRVKEKLDIIGTQKYFHTVIVFPNWSNAFQLAILAKQSHHFFLNGENEIKENQINVIVVRCENDRFGRAIQAGQWFTQTVENQMKYMIKKWRDEDTKRLNPLMGLAKQLKQELRFYHNLILIRNWNFWSSSATITLGVTSTKINSVRAEQGFSHKINPAFANAQIFHVHMLL
ncbi:hypothetical protein niasHT_008171 [Heterodera trifolii]|uniref:Uncharacterized protein n=1 Tax=Heterodera trifolii TaxID=157864 RepID=A0ABD2LX31_9BILA